MKTSLTVLLNVLSSPLLAGGRVLICENSSQVEVANIGPVSEPYHWCSTYSVYEVLLATNPLCMAWDGSCISSLTAGGGEVQFTFVLSFISTLSGGTWGVGCDHDALLKWKAPTSWPYHPVCYWLQTNSLCKRPSATGGLYFGRALNNHCCDLSHIDCAIRLSFTPTWFGSLNVFSIGFNCDWKEIQLGWGSGAQKGLLT